MTDNTVRALLAVFEAGSLNSDQRRAIHNVRVLLGDAEGLGCAHENTAYEAGDALVCQECRQVLNAAVAEPGPDPEVPQ